MGIKHKLQLQFIESSLRFIPTEHLHTIASMAVAEGLDHPDNSRIYTQVQKQLKMRENGFLHKVLLKGGKEIWIKK